MSRLKTDEDGFASVEDCFALLSKPPLFSVRLTGRWGRRPVDCRRKGVYLLRGAMDNDYDHWMRDGRLYASDEVHLVLDCCADIDQLLELFEATKKLSA